MFFQDLSDANEQLSETVVSNQAIMASKRKLEQELSTLNVRLFLSFISKGWIYIFFISLILMRWAMRKKCHLNVLLKPWLMLPGIFLPIDILCLSWMHSQDKVGKLFILICSFLLYSFIALLFFHDIYLLTGFCKLGEWNGSTFNFRRAFVSI